MYAGLADIEDYRTIPAFDPLRKMKKFEELIWNQLLTNKDFLRP
jgi:hypothetical protein